MNNKNDCSAGLVKLDLDELIKVCGNAVSNARNTMNKEEKYIDSCLFEAHLPCTEHDQFIHLCHANTHTEFFMNAARQYAEAVSQYYYLMEAKKREEIQVIR